MKKVQVYAKAIVAFFAPQLTALVVQVQQRHIDTVGLGWSALEGVVLGVLVWAVPNAPQQ